MNILITGGTGLIGTRLSELLTERGHTVMHLSHSQPQANAKYKTFGWNPEDRVYDAEAFRAADAIINLAGAGIADKRWTNKRKEEIVNSRVDSGDLIVKALEETEHKVQAVISASAIGWYGTVQTVAGKFTEKVPVAQDFLALTCYQWEKSIEPVRELNIPLSVVRTGIVLAKNGGAYPKLTLPITFFAMPVFGTGNQIYSWIHIDDLCGIYIKLVEEKADGVYNAVAPEPVTQEELLQTVKKVKRYTSFRLPLPKGIMRRLLGEMSDSLLTNTAVSADKIISDGYRFKYPDIESAVRALEKSTD